MSPEGSSLGISVVESTKLNNNDNDYDYDYDHVPWQPPPSNLQNIDEAARYEDMPPSVFSPTGRLHPVEAAVRASKTPTPLSNLLLAMKCRDGLLVISTLPISPHVDARIEIGTNATRTANSDGDGNSSSNGSNNANANTTATGNSNHDEIDAPPLHPSLFLFEDTCTSTVTGPIFDIHPCIVGATGGNSVDNTIMRNKLLALGLDALESQGALEEDVTTSTVARDLANQLQVPTQDIAAAQKQKLGRMLAVSTQEISRFIDVSMYRSIGVCF
jgi:hypothetical protein